MVFRDFLKQLSEEEEEEVKKAKKVEDEEEDDGDDDEEEECDESAQLQLDLLSQITKKLASADVSVLRRINKLLDSQEEE